jgi:Cu-processing system permease protein
VGLLIGVGIALSFAFTGMAFLLALRIEDKAKALGAAIGIWLLTTVLYDGLVVLLTAMFADNPIERPLIALMFVNPVDLARVLLVLRLDESALMGYTGAVFKNFFGHTAGTTLALLMLSLWAVAPALAARRTFRRKDF